MRFTTTGTLRTLVFDIENAPGTYGPGDYTHPKVTAIAAQFLDEKRPSSWIMSRDKPAFMRDDAEEFREMWDKADAVLGHNIRRHDVKILNGFYVSLGLPVLAPKRMVDTYSDMPKMVGLSRSLENLCDRWGCPVKKLHMSEHDWEMAYDGVPEGVEKMRDRVETDVAINLWLFNELRRRGLLP